MNRKINIASLNLNGLRNQIKKTNTENMIINKNIDILFLQETHFNNKTDSSWSNNWLGTSKWGGDSAHSAGVGIVIHPKHKPITQKYTNNNNGHHMIWTVEIQKQTYTLINTYCPDNSTERKQHLQTLRTDIIQHSPQGSIILGGDFNFVENTKLDRKGGTPRTYHTVGKKEILAIQQNHNLRDAWTNTNNKQGNHFTYHNHNNTIHSRLDRIYTNTPIIKATTTPIHFTDHEMLQIEIEQKIQKRKTYWKLNNSVLTDIQYQNKIRGLLTCNRIHKDEHTTEDWWEYTKLKIKLETQTYCNKRNQQMKTQIDHLYNELEQHTTNNHNDIEGINKIQNNINEISNYKKQGAQVRSRQTLAEEFEIPNQYFYNTEKNRNNKKNITTLEINGKTVTDPQKIKEHVTETYTNIFKTTAVNKNEAKNIIKHTDKKLTEEEKKTLEKQITKDELWNALSTTKPNKAPGTDGLTYEFYTTFWQEIGEDLTDTINKLLQTGNLTYSQRTASITLIPKTKDPKRIDQYRPISLLNTDLKLLTKALSNRLTKILPNIINTPQACAIKGRQIQHHTIQIRDLLTYATGANEELYIISYDMEKAFDLLSWRYLRLTLEHFDFPHQFINTINTLYRNIQSTININGQITKPIQVSRGVRQGCPLSLSLYILTAETLANYINKDHTIKSFPIATTKLLQYADDITAILPTTQDIHKTTQKIEKYCKASGTKLNTNKTHGIAINTKTNLPQEIQWNNNEKKILGIYYNKSYITAQEQNWQVQQNKITNTLNIMRHRDISLKGKAQIINTMVLSKTWYLSAVYPPTPQSLRQINNKIFNYIWNSKHERIKRESLQLPVTQGGVGLLPIQVQTQAIQLKYFNDNESNLKEQIMKIQKKRTHKEPKYYVNTNKLYKTIQPLKENTVREIRKTIQNKKNPNPIIPTTSIRTQIEQEITIQDYTKTTKRNYNTIGKPKQANTFLHVLHNSIPSKHNIQKWYRNDTIDITCSYCTNPETTLHIFTCTQWNPIWTKVAQILQLQDTKWQPKNTADIIFHQPTQKAKSTIIHTTIHHIYMARNNKVYENKHTPIPKILNEIKSDIEYALNIKEGNTTKISKAFGKMVRLEENKIKLNIIVDK